MPGSEPKRPTRGWCGRHFGETRWLFFVFFGYVLYISMIICAYIYIYISVPLSLTIYIYMYICKYVKLYINKYKYKYKPKYKYTYKYNYFCDWSLGEGDGRQTYLGEFISMSLRLPLRLRLLQCCRCCRSQSPHSYIITLVHHRFLRSREGLHHLDAGNGNV
jgi:hypothetical protein